MEEEIFGPVVTVYVYDDAKFTETLSLVNELCDTVTLYVNHWKAMKRMVSKERVGAKYKRTYKKRAMTPYERVMARNDIEHGLKEKLRTEHDLLNPLLLLEEDCYAEEKDLRANQNDAESSCG